MVKARCGLPRSSLPGGGGDSVVWFSGGASVHRHSMTALPVDGVAIGKTIALSCSPGKGAQRLHPGSQGSIPRMR